MRDVLYILGNKSKWADNELRYSLRSLERYCLGTFDRVIVAGHIPSFVDPAAVVTLPMPEPTGHTRHWNQVIKVRRAIAIAGIERFAWFADDIYFTRRMSIDDLPTYDHGELPAPGFHDPDDTFQSYLARTRAALEADGLPVRNYDGHHPVAMDAEKFLAVAEGIEQRHGAAVSLKAYYPNFWQTTKVVRRQDFKADPAVWRAGFELSVWDNHQGIFSLPSTIRPAVAAWFAATYPKPSRFER